MKITHPDSLSAYCSFDTVYNDLLAPFLNDLDDSRAYNHSYPLSDCLKAGFSIYSLKAPSLYQFQQMAQTEEHNLHQVYKIGAVPSDNGLRKVLDGLSPEVLRAGFERLTKYLLSNNELRRRYHAWKDYTIVSVDGVEHFCSKQVSCEHCLNRKHRDETTSYYHSMLSAVIVHPEHAEVFPLDHEPIVKQDGELKNDCERNAVHRLLDNIEHAHPQLNTIFTMDALYACGPVIRRLNAVDNWRYVISVKEMGNRHLFEQFDALNDVGRVKWIDHRDVKKSEWQIGYVNGLELNASASDVKVNMIYARAKKAKGKEVIFSYLTNIKVTKNNAWSLLSTGRSRWKIENETFNTLKNQGYHFKHNFGHGKQHLCTVMSYLMMMAFWVDQLQQAGDKTFQAIIAVLKTRVKLWESMRAVFKIVAIQSMYQLYFKIADMYCVRLT